jgi:tetratricopeptide (TPR) repeat protein
MAASGSEEARAHLNRGIEALHNFWYDAAREAFGQAQALEPNFVLAVWGEAFSHHYPFGFSGGELEEIRAALDRLAPTPKARAALARTDRERRYLDAIEVLAGEGTEQQRRRGFSQAMRALAEAYPDDPEAWAFYAISVFGTEQNIRGVPAARAEAARAARRVLAIAPRHPGGLHYAIHALDTPETAEDVLEIARTYATVSHTASHAIHMPSHIFMQLARWDDAIDVNRRAFEASERWVAQSGRELHDRDYHAADFLHYSLLQKGQMDAAHRWVDEMAQLGQTSDHWSAKWYRASWAARERIEAAAWGAGPLPKSGFEGRDELLAAGMDAAMTGDLDTAREILGAMRSKVESARASGSATFPAARWQVAAGELDGLIAAREGRLDDARRALDEALEAFASLPPPNETPDPAKPPYELLGDILLDAGHAEAAMDAYRRQLELRRGRARSLIGLARAARAADHTHVARDAYQRLLEHWAEADEDRPELQEARDFPGWDVR